MAEHHHEHEHEHHHHFEMPQKSRMEEVLSKYNLEITDEEVKEAVKKIIAEKVAERRERAGLYRARKPVRRELPSPTPRSHHLRISTLCKSGF